MWKLIKSSPSKYDQTYRITHIHGNIAIYLFNADLYCNLCKELVPSCINVQKNLIDNSINDIYFKMKSDENRVYYSVDIISLNFFITVDRPFNKIKYPKNIDKNPELKKEIDNLFERYK